MTSKSQGGGTKKSDFFEIKDEATIKKLLDLASRHKVPFTIWFKKNTLRFDAKMPVLLTAAKLMGFDLPPHITEQMFNDTLAEQGSSEIMGSFRIDTVNFFFKSTAAPKQERDFLKIDIPTLIYKLQRRADMRIPLSRSTAPKLTFLNPAKEHSPDKPVLDSDILAYRMLDISVGGLGFAAKVEDKGMYTVGTKLVDMRFNFRNTSITSLGIVRHVATILSDQGKPILKVGAQFHALRPEYGQLIFSFVLEESRKLFQLLQEAGGGGSK